MVGYYGTLEADKTVISGQFCLIIELVGQNSTFLLSLSQIYFHLRILAVILQ